MLDHMLSPLSTQIFLIAVRLQNNDVTKLFYDIIELQKSVVQLETQA